jgi:MFS transporter, Spinster family, sphingosine-1-phosphate transporter
VYSCAGEIGHTSAEGETVRLPSEAPDVPDAPGRLTRTQVRVAFAVLISLNLLNYLDRHLLPGALPLMQKSMAVGDAQIGALTSWFFVAYMYAAPLLGWLGDRFSRRRLVLLSVLWWSCAIGCAALAGSFIWFQYAYILAGVGEAAFGVYAVSLLSDYFPGRDRNWALSMFLLAMPAGRALGFPIGGSVAERFGWQAPFQLCAIAGVTLVIIAVAMMPDPVKGSASSVKSRPLARGGRLPFTVSYRSLLSWTYLCAVLGLAMHTFALGGLTAWLPMYLYRYGGYSASRASALLGSAALLCGLSGTWLGGVLGDRLLLRQRGALYWLSAASLLMAVPCVCVILLGSQAGMLAGTIGMQFFFFLGLGPLNTAILNSIPAAVRSTAIAVALLLVHALGDALSPRLIGGISDKLGLRIGMSITVVSLIAGALVLFAGVKCAPTVDRLTGGQS